MTLLDTRSLPQAHKLTTIVKLILRDLSLFEGLYKLASFPQRDGPEREGCRYIHVIPSTPQVFG